jgi:hypothetical protein
VEDVLVVPNQAVRSAGNQRTVTVLFEGQQIQIPVNVGLVGDSLTEIIGDALREGDEVVTSTSSSSASPASNRFQGDGFEGPPGGGGFFVP